jgi:Abortive infection C-terminus
MFLLYNGNESSSRGFRLLKKVHQIKSDLIVRNAVRVLRLVGHNLEAADTLEKLPFELWEGTNGFNDTFDLLVLKVPISKYLEIELAADTYRGKTLYDNIAQALSEAGNPVRFIAMDADTETPDAISTPLLQKKSLAVSRALNDFELLINSKGGAVSSVDRIHTALHGYLRVICEESAIPCSADADITTLFKVIRERHPKFQPPGGEVTKILRGFAQIVDAMNPVRNHHSMAHPSDELLDEPEALLAINAVKSLLHYLNNKLR